MGIFALIFMLIMLMLLNSKAIAVRMEKRTRKARIAHIRNRFNWIVASRNKVSVKDLWEYAKMQIHYQKPDLEEIPLKMEIAKSEIDTLIKELTYRGVIKKGVIYLPRQQCFQMVLQRLNLPY